MKLPDELQHLQNIIKGAKNQPNDCEALLRMAIRNAADEAPAAHVIRLAEFILQLGIEAEESRSSRFN